MVLSKSSSMMMLTGKKGALSGLVIGLLLTIFVIVYGHVLLLTFICVFVPCFSLIGLCVGLAISKKKADAWARRQEYPKRGRERIRVVKESKDANLLKELYELKEKGIISESEFRTRKWDILGKQQME